MFRTEGYFKGYDHKDLYCQSWQQENAKLNILVTHGLAEHSEAYQRLAEGIMKNLPVNLVAWDLRGHGKSYGKRGLVKTFDEYVKDFFSFYHFVKKEDSLPMVFLGHSMGGLITTKALLDYKKEMNPKALVLSSPLLGIEMRVSKLKELSADYLAKYLPSFTMDNQIDFKSLTHDLDIVEEYERDPLRHSRICPRLYLDFIEIFPDIFARAKTLELPFLLQVAGEDHLVSKKSSLDFFDRVGSKEKNKIEYSNLYHEIYNEVEREKVYKDLSQFLEKYID